MTEERAVEVLLSLQAHARLWDPDAHLLGTLRFGEVAEAITEVLVRREQREALLSKIDPLWKIQGALDLMMDHVAEQGRGEK